MFIAIARVGNGRRERIFPLREIKAENATHALYQLHGMLKREGVKVVQGPQHFEWENLIFSILEIGTDQDFKDLLVAALLFAENERERYLDFLHLNP